MGNGRSGSACTRREARCWAIPHPPRAGLALPRGKKYCNAGSASHAAVHPFQSTPEGRQRVLPGAIFRALAVLRFHCGACHFRVLRIRVIPFAVREK